MIKPQLVLASASPARLATLRRAGIEPEVIVSGVDESGLAGADPAGTAQVLATAKAEAVLHRLEPRQRPTLVLGCDSLLELDGAAWGKPGTPQEAGQRWQRMRGRTATLHTGHCLIDAATGGRSTAVASTLVRFAEVSDAEIEAYVASGEPLHVAGAFTVDGLGGAFVESIAGDHHNVVGVSLPLLRGLAAELGVAWHTFWDISG